MGLLSRLTRDPLEMRTTLVDETVSHLLLRTGGNNPIAPINGQGAANPNPIHSMAH